MDGSFWLGLFLFWGSLQRRRCLDCICLIVSAGSSELYRMDRIGWIVFLSVLGSLGETGFYALTGLILAGWDGWTGWDVGRTGVG